MLTRLLQDERFIRMNLAQRIEAIELILLEKLEAEEKWLHPDFLNCMNLILQTDQPVDQNDLIRHCAIGARQLERLFRRYTGLTPKKMINLTRFQKVWRRMYCTRTCDSMELVHHFGYVDQSHFIREFKTFSGMTPNKMLQRL
ncbi:helix-turn-helix domain-containing protein [Bacillus sp. JCM 19034]|uniref:helix-turn-helix domain-containing protein n=1 Tax=Bacillus sp. JCM 19034 TaxID=1481928 RepID=UPI000782FEE7|nr:helix-turn-helix domain-containing protein [Bacillus sp. JCM 19034]